jgi:hypothetical protein
VADKEKKTLRWNFFLSLLIHLIIIAGLASVTVHVYKNHSATNAAVAGGGGQADAQQPAPKIDQQAVTKNLEKEDARVAAMSDEDKMAELQKKAGQLSNMDSRAVDAVAATVETVKGADKSRAYEPQKNATGKFDPNTATLYDITKENRNDDSIFVYTLVDAEGRTMTAERKLEEMSADDMRAYQLFNMSRNNKNMARLLKSAIMIGQSQTTDSAKKSGSPTSK